MNYRKNILLLLMLLPLVAFIGALFIFPSQIPMHFNLIGNVDRVGSVFELLIFFAVALVLGGIGLPIVKYTDARSEAWLFPLLSLLALNLVMVYVMLYIGYTAQGLIPVSLVRYLCLLFGLSMVFSGFKFHKSKLNSGKGFKTHWSLRNEAAWSLTQRWSGVLFVLGGLLISVESVVLIMDLVVLVAVVATFVMCCIFCVFSSWCAAKRVSYR